MPRWVLYGLMFEVEDACEPVRLERVLQRLGNHYPIGAEIAAVQPQMRTTDLLQIVDQLSPRTIAPPLGATPMLIEIKRRQGVVYAVDPIAGIEPIVRD